MAESVAEAVVYLVISNIPVAFRSADLRNYFSQFIESGGFTCFHYRHRPELLREKESRTLAVGAGEEFSSQLAEDGSPADTQPGKSCCCVVSVRVEEAERLIRMYAGNHWIDSKGNWLARRCIIRRVRASQLIGQ